MITVVSTPACEVTCDPAVVPPVYSYWLATESPNIFQLLRQDWLVTVGSAGPALLNFPEPAGFAGVVGDVISCHNHTTDAILTGEILNIAGNVIYTDIPFVTGMDIDYVNDNTLYAGFYFEAQLIINGITYPLKIIASPNRFGYADIDVSGVLRIVTSLGKDGDYSVPFGDPLSIHKEETKSGRFEFEYRVRYFGKSSDETVNPFIPLASPNIEWFYAECVRSEEQGSNLHEYVGSECTDAPFLNSFDKPVYFHGLPWDISFILPELYHSSPGVDITISVQFYNSYNTTIGAALTKSLDVDALEIDGHVVSLAIDSTLVPSGATYFTAEILVP
jgi:hypothetical protein